MNASPAPPAALRDRYASVRARTERLCGTLETEDHVVQSMPDASPAKWHLAHTTWFFETFVLGARDGYRPFHPEYAVLFNSYYNAVGPQWPRPQRGLLSRPTVREVYAYREHVDDRMRVFLDEGAGELAGVVEVGLHHEQQHQELLLTDLKHLLSLNPLHPVYRAAEPPSAVAVPPVRWLEFAEGVREIGHAGQGFAFDNERPRHREFLNAFRLADRLVTSGEYLEFMADDGYRRPELWLSEGWAAVQGHGWAAPLYWTQRDGAWFQFTLSGLRPVAPSEPVCHVSGFEADAFASWAGARLPGEAEWETAAEAQAADRAETPAVALQGNLGGTEAAGEVHHPLPLTAPPAPGTAAQLYGDVWEWTRSPYSPYPGYVTPPGAIGEYNGKFMVNQLVLRGGSCATPRDHIRSTYRNFFPPLARWQFSGLRLARDA